MQQEHGKRNITLILVLLAVHAVYFLLALYYKRIYNGDSFEYIYAAVNLKENLFFYSGNPAMTIEPEYMTFRTPLYPLLLAAVYTFALNNWLVLALQNLLSVWNIMLARSMLFRFGYKPKYDWLLLLLVITWPAQFIHANTVEPEILLQSCVLLYVYQLLAFFKERKTRFAWGMSLALVGGLFVKPVLYPYTALHLLLMLFLAFRQQTGLHRQAQQLLTALLPVIAIISYNAWNASRTGKFHFTSNQSFNAIYYFYYYKSATEGIPAAQEFLRKERATMAAMPVFKDRYDYANERGKALLKEHMAGYIPYHLKHSMRFFVDPGKGDIDLFTGRLTYGRLYSDQTRGFRAYIQEYGWWQGVIRFAGDQPSVWLAGVVFLFNLVKLVGLVLFAINRRIPPGVRIFVLLFLAYFAVLTGPISTPRYVLPVSLLYMGAAALGFILFYESRKDQKRKAENGNGYAPVH